jgi:hypothetical protein
MACCCASRGAGEVAARRLDRVTIRRLPTQIGVLYYVLRVGA